MTVRVKYLYHSAILNSEFMLELGSYEDHPDWLERNDDELGRHLIAMAYWGWLIGKKMEDEIRKIKNYKK